jgi:hypothetical protein
MEEKRECKTCKYKNVPPEVFEPCSSCVKDITTDHKNYVNELDEK